MPDDATPLDGAPRDAPPDGFVSASYLTERFVDERYRAGRYRQPLAILLAHTDGRRPVAQAELGLQRWLRSHVRLSDLAAYLGSGRYLLLLPYTDREGASSLQSRLGSEFRGTDVRTGIAVLGEDGDSLPDLIDAASGTARGTIAHSA